MPKRRRRKKTLVSTPVVLAPLVPHERIRYHSVYIDWRKLKVKRIGVEFMKRCNHDFVGNFRVETARGVAAVEGDGKCIKCGATIREVVSGFQGL